MRLTTAAQVGGWESRAPAEPPPLTARRAVKKAGAGTAGAFCCFPLCLSVFPLGAVGNSTAVLLYRGPQCHIEIVVML